MAASHLAYSPNDCTHEPEGRGALLEERLVEPAVRIAQSPLGLGLVPKSADLELAPGVAAIAGIEGGPSGLGAGRRPGEKGVGLEAVDGLVHRHRAGVDADGDGQSGHPHESFKGDPGAVTGIVGPKPLLEAELLGVMGPSFDEGVRQQGPPDLAVDAAQAAKVGEVAGRHLVHGDRRQGGGTEDAQPLLLLVDRPRRLWGRDVVPRRGVVLEGRRRADHRHRPPPRRRCRSDPALPVDVGHEAVGEGEGDDLLDEADGLVDHARAVRVVGEEGGHDLRYRAARLDPPARLVQDVAEAAALGVGSKGQASEIHRHGFGCTHQPGQRHRTDGRIGIAAPSEVLHPRHETSMGRPRLPPSHRRLHGPGRRPDPPRRGAGRRRPAPALPPATRGRRPPRRAMRSGVDAERPGAARRARTAGRSRPGPGSAGAGADFGGAVRAPRRRFDPAPRRPRDEPRSPGRTWAGRQGGRAHPALRSARGPAPRRHSREARRTPGPRGRTTH